MTLHVFANIVTPYGTAANNRGETEGNRTTLQKLLWRGLTHTTLIAESIRFALRRLLAEMERNGTNRRYNEETRANEWQNADFSAWAEGSGFIDDDLLGFMSAEAAREEGEGPAEVSASQQAGRAKRPPKGTATVRRGVLEITRAVSLTPWAGDVIFNAASPRATPSAAKKGSDNPVPYGAEVHATRYQYGLAMTPARLRDPSRAAKALQALANLHTVAGNHGRFLFDFSPESVVMRITEDSAARLLYCFDTTDDGQTVESPALQARVEQGDIVASELILGGPFARSETAGWLVKQGAAVAQPGGIKAAVEEAVRRIQAGLSKGR